MDSAALTGTSGKAWPRIQGTGFGLPLEAAFYGWNPTRGKGEGVDFVMLVIGALAMLLMFGFAKGLDKL